MPLKCPKCQGSLKLTVLATMNYEATLDDEGNVVKWDIQEDSIELSDDPWDWDLHCPGCGTEYAFTFGTKEGLPTQLLEIKDLEPSWDGYPSKESTEDSSNPIERG